MRRIYLLLLILYVVIRCTPFFPLPIRLISAGAVFLLGLIIGAGNGMKICNRSYIIWTVVWLMYAAVSSLWAIRFNISAWNILVDVLPILLVCYSVQFFVRNQDDLLSVFKSFYIASIIILCILIVFVDLSELEGNRMTYVTDNDEKWNSNFVALQLVVAIYLGYFSYWRTKHHKLISRFFYLIITATMVVVIGLCGSRAALVCLIIPVFVNKLFERGGFVKALFLVAVVLGVGFILVFNIPILYSNIGVRIEELLAILSGNDDGTEDVSRFILAAAGLEWFKSSPIIGYGIKNFMVLSEKTIFEGFYAHNNYIELLVDVGILGLITYYSSYVYLFRKRRLLDNYSKHWLVAFLVLILFADLANVSYYDFTLQFVLCICFCVTKLFIANRKNENG